MARTFSREVDGVSQAFSKVGEIPGPTVVAAIEMATGATHVTFLRELGIVGVVEKLFP